MRRFKQLTITAIATIFLSTPLISTAGEKTVGVTGGYNTRNDCAVAGLFFRYKFNPLLRIAPDITYLFKNRDVDGLSFNVNLHMPLHVVPRVDFYPLAGFNYTSWNYHNRDTDETIIESDDVTIRTNRLGLNIGGGVEIKATPTLRLFIEGKYTGVRHYSSGTISAGIGYRF